MPNVRESTPVNQCLGTTADKGKTDKYSFFIGTTKKRKIVAENLTCPWRSVDEDANLAMENSLRALGLHNVM